MTQVGTLAPGNEFEPKHALIIKDKDDLQVRAPCFFCAPKITNTTHTYLSEVNLQPKSFLALTLTCTYPAFNFAQVPLILETIPTPAEFRDAIESLSPEQQRFAKAYRGMQLASTLFAVAVVQIKPQLERLLGLPDGRWVCSV